LLEEHISGQPLKKTPVSAQAALEETFFLGLRLTKGVNLKIAASEFGDSAVRTFSDSISQCTQLGLLEHEGDVIRLTPRGRLLSNEVFERFIFAPDSAR